MVTFINLLTFSRIVLAAIIFLLLMSSDGYLLALILFYIAGFTDWLDGYLARKYNAVSQLGEILDPIADKILVLFVYDRPAIGSSNAVFCELSSPLINSSRLFKLSICGTNCAPSFALEHVEVLLWRSE